ncbi:glycosyltransferase family 4 protein, partial [Pediococcus acidilactici]|uniref:glycosyltransferase family 4 protein n=1 Tax=Pediococcus acidilactici TaxID=1254 RepID=UPI001F3DD629
DVYKRQALSARFIKEKKMITIKNSIPDVKQMKSTKSSGDFYRNLVFIGRLDKQKGIDLLIKAVDKINKKHNNILKLTVIGDSVIDDEIIEKSDINGVEFLGWQSAANVQKMLVQSKALIIPSRWEGFGLTALEAMRASKMVLASDAGALPEIILNKTTGLIFRKDSIESLEEVLESFILLSQNEIEEYGKKGRERYITYFNYSNFVDEINNLYGEVVKSE